MTVITPLPQIAGVQLAMLKGYADERGRFMETFRKEWFPQRAWSSVQCNRSDSAKGVLRGLHFHHHQVDYWYVPFGRLRVGLVDIRTGSPTYLSSTTIELGSDNEVGLYIPSGVAHGFAALTDVTLIYTVDSYYDGGKDEWGVAWNDPQFKLNWGVSEPALSQRDLQNPLLGEIPAAQLPTFTAS